MRRARGAVGGLLAAAALAACAPGPVPSARAVPLPDLPAPVRERPPERVVLISVHGLTPGHVLPAPGTEPALPFLAALARDGVVAERVVPVFPPAVYPAHTSLVSGQPPREHGIPADHRLGRYGIGAESFAQASEVRGPTLWQAVTASGRSVAALDWPATGGAAVAALLPDAAPTRAGQTWLGLLEERATPWVLDLVREAGGALPAAGFPGPAHDTVLVRVACGLLASAAPPVLLLLRLSQTAPALARFGPDSAEARAAFARVDRELASLVACAERAGRLDRLAWAVAGDQALRPVHTEIHANEFLARAGVIQAGPTREISSWQAIARSNGGSAFVYAENEGAAVTAREALGEAARRTRAFRILSADAMLALGGDPKAWFGLVAAPGYAFTDRLASPPLRPSRVRAGSGYLPADPEMATGFVAWGVGVRRKLRVPEMEQADVAPTLAQMLGVDLGGVEGRVLVGLLSGIEPRPRLRVRGVNDGGR